MLAQLLKYGSVTTDMLTPFIVADIVGTVMSKRVDIDDKLFGEIVGALKADDVHRLADIVQKPELISRLKSLVEKQESAHDDNMTICPHCGEWFAN